MRLLPPAAALAALGLPCVVRAGFVPAPVQPAVQDATGATLADVNGDHHVDLLTFDGTVRLGAGDGTFVDGPDCTGAGQPIVADFDNDGYADVLRILDAPVMCRGGAGGTLTVDPDGVEPGPFVGVHHLGAQIAYSGIVADLDGDGWLDLYLADYEDANPPSNPSAFVPFPDLVYRNDGTGRLELLGELPQGYVLNGRGATVGDYDGDGDQDVYVANYRLTRDFLWENDGGGGLTEVADDRGVGDWGHGISAVFADLDGDGELDLVVGNLAHPGQSTVTVYRNRLAATGTFERLEETDSGITWQESFASVALGDYDADGGPDLFVTTVYAGDAGRLFHNLGDGTFEDVTTSEGVEQREGYGVAWGDVNEDGALDLFVGGAQPTRLWLGTPGPNHSLRVRLAGDGVAVPRTPVGARVTATFAGRTVVREWQVSGTGGDRGASEPTIHLGLADHAGEVSVEVRWPGGVVCLYEGSADTTLDVSFDAADPACVGAGGSGSGGSSTGAAGSSGGASGSGSSMGSTSAGGASFGTDGATSSAASGGADAAGTGCGCVASQGAPASGWLGLLAPWLVRRRRPRRSPRRQRARAAG